MYNMLYITIAQGVSGYYTVLYDNEPEAGPILTGIGRYEDIDDAITEGLNWARADGLRFVMPKREK